MTPVVLGLAGVVTVMAAAEAVTQVGCLPLEKPHPYEPLQGASERRAMINEQYEAYVLGVEDHFNCLRGKDDRAGTEARAVIGQRIAYFDEEAMAQLHRRCSEESS